MGMYRVQRVWTVTIESWSEVEADDRAEAERLALEDGCYDDWQIIDPAGPTEIGRVEVGVESFVYSPDVQRLLANLTKERGK